MTLGPKTTRILVWLAFLGFACRALIPVGYMPGPFGDYGPVRLCHGGLSPALLQALEQPPHTADAADVHAGHRKQHDAHRDHPTDGGPDHGGWDHCPVGNLFSWAALAIQIDLNILTLEHALGVGTKPTPVDLPFQRPYRARAPPVE